MSGKVATGDLISNRHQLLEVVALLVKQFGYFDGVREMAERICNYMNIDVGR